MAKVVNKWNRWRAARNLAHLHSGNATSEEARQINPWLSDNTEYQSEFFGTAYLLSNMEELADDPDLATWKEDTTKTGALEKVRNNWPALAAAAGILLAVAIGTNVLFDTGSQINSQGNIQRYVTRIGEQKTIELPDGSTIAMNTGTLMLVDFDNEKRRILLERGEAYFDVAKDPQRPFRVDLATHSVTVLGTAFNIRTSPDKISLAVLEGLISLHQKNESVSPDAPLMTAPMGNSLHMDAPSQYRLEAGWVAELDITHNELSGYEPENMDRFESWRSGIISIEGEPLFKVVQELNRYTPKKILIEDAEIINLKMYGILRVDRINTTLSTMEKTLPIKVTHHFDRIVLTSAR
ncbi:FecR domain-containing protein [Porticoccaceae bacterium LTM1]|nr:FecR domain-containing protein [Porticoccaceae bacterium LTM1]